uniref:Indoleamine-dioxygenase n=1 Tax=Claviceps paspali TaxID=40601 RepID=J7FIX9_CLAPA|nr:indoleamine-dioxygenase [Claviceps paspali]
MSQTQTPSWPSGNTETGFLSRDGALHSPPEAYYQPWEVIALGLPELIPKRGVRNAVRKLEELSTDGLSTEAHRRWAYVRLSFIAQAYIWCGGTIRGGGGQGDEDDDNVQSHLPPQLAVPLLQISSRLHLPPIMTYAATCLWNFQCVGADEADLDEPENIRSVVTFTGGESESWFFGISIAMEARGARVIPVLTDALRADDEDEDEDEDETRRNLRRGRLAAALDHLGRCVDDLTRLLGRMYERCDPSAFYHDIRPFLAGGKGVSQLPRGVFYDTGDGHGLWRQLRGGSNGQSTLFQLFDRFLGIRHPAGFHDEMKAYMPLDHRRLLDRVERTSDVRELVAALPPDHDLRASYTSVVDALSRLRAKHLELVARYIVVPSSSSSSGPAAVGTAGTSPIPFLRETRRSTMLAGNLAI